MGSGGGTPKETEQEKALAQRASQEWDYYKAAFRPAEQAAPALFRATEGRKQEARGLAAADAMQAMGTQPGAHIDQFAKQAVAYHDVGQTAAGLGIAGAEHGVEDAERSGLMRMAKYGRGLADDSNQGLANAARNATEMSLQKSRNKTQRYVDTVNAISTVAGAGIGKWADNKWGPER